MTAPVTSRTTGRTFRIPRPVALAGVAVGALLVLSSAFPVGWPLGTIVQGAILGAASGLLALGLVLVYRTARVINFAYGAMGSCAAQVGIVAFEVHELPWLLCVVIALVAGVGIGLLVDVVLARFRNAPRLVVTVATIGLLQVLIGLQFGVAYWSGARALVAPFSTPLSESTFTIGTSLFNLNDAVLIALVPLAVIGLSTFLLGTDAGKAVRAIADNRERAALLGIPTHRLTRIVWILVGGLAGVVSILVAPANGLPASPFVSVGGIFMPALAAAVIAKMEDLPVAFVSGVGLGVFNAVVANNVRKASISTVALLAVVLAALLLRKWTTSRAEEAESSWSLSGTSQPLPPDIAALPEVRLGRAAVGGLVAAAAVAFPFLAPLARVHTVSGYLVLGIVVVSLVILSGWAGTVSLGQYAIVGVGGVVAGNMIASHNLDLFFALALGGLAAAALSVVVGLPALRVRPLFLAVTTLMFAAAMDQFVLNPANFPDEIPGVIDRPVLFKRFPLESERATYFVILTTLAVAALVAHNLRGKRPGRLLLASRDNDRAAAAVTVPVTRTRVAGMAVAGLFAGVAGALAGVLEMGIGSSSFPAQTSVLLFSMAVVGGLSSVSGALAGVGVVQLLIFLIGLTTSQGDSFASLGTGALMLVFLLAFPGGIAQLVTSVRDRYVAVVSRRRGIARTVAAADGSAEVEDGSEAEAEDEDVTLVIDLGSEPAAVGANGDTAGNAAGEPSSEDAEADAHADADGEAHADADADADVETDAVAEDDVEADADGETDAVAEAEAGVDDQDVTLAMADDDATVAELWPAGRDDVPDSMVACRGLEAAYGPLQVLFGVDLDVGDAEVVALLGTNGAGKSTVFRVITGLLPASAGTVWFDGDDITGLRTDEIARRGLALMPGGRGVFPTMTVAENLHLACWQLRRDRHAVESAIAEAIEMFPVLGERSQQMAGNLSGGEQQQLSLAMAFMARPAVLLIDELSLGLAPTVVGMLCEKVREINEAGTTIVAVEQSVNVALQLAERAVFLEKGAVRYEGPTHELLDRPDILRSVFIGGGTDPQTADDDDADDADGSGNGSAPARARDLTLRLEGVTKRFGGVTAVRDVDLLVEPGSIVGLIGHNGAGKTTLFDLISGFLTPDGGSIRLSGRDISDLPPHQRAGLELGRSFQEARLFPSLTVEETIMVALDRHATSHDWLAAGLALPAATDADAGASTRAEELMDLLGLRGFSSTPIADLSTGTRRIVELACMLAMDPAVLLLDEPSAGVAQRETEALGPLLRRIQRSTGTSIVIIEHDMTLLTSLCDRLVALDTGTVIFDGPAAEALSHPQVIESYLGVDEAAIQRSGAAVG